MNRRNFIAGLLATTAAVPLAKAGFAADMGGETMVAWDVGADDSAAITYIWHRSALGYATTLEEISPEFLSRVLYEPPSPQLEQAISNLGAVRQEVVEAFGIPAHLLREPPWEAKQAAMRELILKERQVNRSKMP